MKTLTLDTLVTVTGGAGKNDAVTQQLTTLQGAIKDLASSQNKGGGGTDTMTMMMMMAMALRPQPTAVAAAPAAGPIINISTRFRR